MELEKINEKSCRICLKVQGFISVFDKLSDSVIADLISFVTGVKIKRSENQDIPFKICGNCLQNVQAAKNLKTICQENDTLIKQKFETQEAPGDPPNSPHTFIKVEAEIKEENCADHWDNSFEIEPGKSSFTCDKCGKSLGNKECLNMHLKSHLKIPGKRKRTGEKKDFSCSICSRTFSRKFNLQMHQKTHTGEKPFKCEYCHLQGVSRLFSQKLSYKRHLMLHTKNWKFYCSYCNKGFSEGYALRYHEEKHESGNFNPPRRRIRIGDQVEPTKPVFNTEK